jgi:hypothetical protein
MLPITWGPALQTPVKVGKYHITRYSVDGSGIYLKYTTDANLFTTYIPQLKSVQEVTESAINRLLDMYTDIRARGDHPPLIVLFLCQ